MPLLISILTAVLLLTPTSLTAQTKSKSTFRKKLDSLLTLRYFKTSYDTNYVVRPKGRLTLKARVNQTGNDIYSKGTMDGVDVKADFRTPDKTTFSLSAIYRGIGIGFAINPAKMSGSYKDYELNINFYSSRFSLDFSYQRSVSMTGDMRFGDITGQLESGEATMKVINLAGYYTFNHRRFSYPAAFSQSYIQRRSAGTWLAGLSYQGGSIETNDALKERFPDAPNVRVYTGNFGIGGGYGYNWVLGRKWLLHLSALPTFVVFNRNNMTVNGERRDAKRVRFNMIFNERAAVVYQFSPRYFAGITFVMNNTVSQDDEVVVNQNKWRGRAFLGMRLGK